MADPEVFWRDNWRSAWGSFTLRKFSASFGVRPLIAFIVWGFLSPEAFTPLDLLMCLHFLATYPTWDAGATHFGVSTPTFEYHVIAVLEALHTSMNVIDYRTRFHNQCPLGVFITVDCTLCRLQVDRTDWEWQRFWFAGDKWYHALKYEVAVHAWTGDILWVRGPWRGPESDTTILNTLPAGLLLPNEHMYADEGYVGHPLCYTHFKRQQVSHSLQHRMTGTSS